MIQAEKKKTERKQTRNCSSISIIKKKSLENVGNFHLNTSQKRNPSGLCEAKDKRHTFFKKRSFLKSLIRKSLLPFWLIWLNN